jgi:putative DNA primase/helicase
MDRSIEIAMQRKLNEKVERLRRRDNDGHAELRRKCLRWANDNRKVLATIEPKLPEGLNDRAVDIWEPLLAIAEQVGGGWPKLAAEAAIAFSGGGAATEERSVELLADIKAIFGASGEDEITTQALITALCADEERPWATWNKGKSISDRQVAKLLKQFPIVSEDVRPPGQGHAKGYKKARFLDPFERYLSPTNHASFRSEGSQACERASADGMGATCDFSIRAESNLHGCEKREKPANDGGLHACTDKTPSRGDEAVENDLEAEEYREALLPRSADDLSIPPSLRRCEQCGAPSDPNKGAVTQRDFGGIRHWLHPRCEFEF